MAVVEAAATAAAVVVVFVPAATASVVELPAALATAPAAAAAPPFVMTTQFPKPALVVNETRHWLPAEPPVHVVPAGSVPDTWTVPVEGGLATPFLVMVTLPVKLFPVPVVSTVADLIAVEPSVPLCSKDKDERDGQFKKERDDAYALKFCTETVKAPLFAATGVEVPMVEATLMLPQGLAVDGLCTSERAAVPVTPRGGSMMAWPSA